MNVDVHLHEAGLPPVRVGTVTPSLQGRALASTRFRYDPDYLALDGRYALSPDLPLDSSTHWTPADRTLFGAFADVAPDEWGQRVVRSSRPSGRLNLLDFLLGVSDTTRTGALRFAPAGTQDWLTTDASVANLHDLDRILVAARRYDDDEATDEDVQYLADVATSPGGARPKANMIGEHGEHLLVKLPHSKDGRIDVERWEAVALDLAASAGIDVPTHRLHRVGEHSSVLELRRFDRTGTGDRLGYLSARTLLDAGDRADADFTYVDFADVLGETSGSPRADLAELYRRVAFSVLVSNTDDHWRNHAVLHGPDGWRLAPAFDLNPNRAFLGASPRAITSSAAGGDRSIGELHGASSFFRLTDAAAREIIGDVATAVAGWRTMAAQYDLAVTDIERMAPAFREDELHAAHAVADG